MFRVCIAGALTLLLSACGTMNARIALEPTVKQKINEVKVLSILPQDEVIVRAESFGASAALGGGLIAALIDSKVAEGRQATLQETLSPFYRAVDNFDFRSLYQPELAEALANNKTMKFAPLEHTTLIPLTKDAATRVAALKPGAGLLDIYTRYNFTSDFSRLNVTAYVEMRTPDSSTPVFKNILYYQSNSTGAGGTDSIKAWSDNMGYQYRATLAEATKSIIQMLELDLADGKADKPNAEKVTLEKVEGPAKIKVAGSLLAQSGGRKVLRDAQGNIYSLPQ